MRRREFIAGLGGTLAWPVIRVHRSLHGHDVLPFCYMGSKAILYGISGLRHFVKNLSVWGGWRAKT